MKYKCVPAPMEIVINNKSSYDQAVRSFADIINRESIEGWIFHSMETIKVRQNPGCLGALFGKGVTIEEYNMLVFSNVDDSAYLKWKEKNYLIEKKENEYNNIGIDHKMENKINKILENMNVDNKKYVSKILSDQNNVNVIYDLLISKGKIEMNEYFKNKIIN